MEGIVIKTTGKYYTVRKDDLEIVKCRLKGKFRITVFRSTNPIVVGDRVEIERNSEYWMIVQLKKRKNQIVRKSVKLSKQEHIIAANIDQVILMITLDSPVTSTSFIDRFLVAANSYNINVIMLFNKSDLLLGELQIKQDYLKDVYERIGYKCFSLSVINDDLSNIKDLMKGKVNMISGHSGVGKSTFINKLQDNLEIKTNEISFNHKQGQHTTTFSEMYNLDFGAYIIDTPGIKGFGLVAIDINKIGNFFPEFVSLKSACKFHNCMHKEEPLCAVKIGLEKGNIAESRYKNYITMLSEKPNDFRLNDY